MRDRARLAERQRALLGARQASSWPQLAQLEARISAGIAAALRTGAALPPAQPPAAPAPAAASADAAPTSAAPAPFSGPCADSLAGELLLDVLPIVAAVGFAAEVSHCRALCGLTLRAFQRGDTNDMIVSSLRLQCGEREAKTARREDFFDVIAEWTGDGQGARLEDTTQLIRATMLNNLPRVLQLIQIGAPLDAEDGEGSTALHWAVSMGHEEIFKALLDGKYEGRGAMIEFENQFGTTALVLACEARNSKLVRLLLARGARQDSPSHRGYHRGYTGLHVAVYNDDAEIVSLLAAAPRFAAALTLRAPDFRNGGSIMTPLEMAVFYGRRKIKAILRANGA